MARERERAAKMRYRAAVYVLYTYFRLAIAIEFNSSHRSRAINHNESNETWLYDRRRVIARTLY